MQPKSVVTGKDGALWVADTFSDRVQKLTAAGEFVASYSRVGTFGPAPGGGAGEFRNPYGVAVDLASGAVYVADTGNDRIQRFDGTSWTALAGATFNAPRGVAVDASGRVLVADSGNNRVLRLAGTTWSTVGAGLARPEAIATHGTSVYVADTGNSRVIKLDATTGRCKRTMAASEPEGVALDECRERHRRRHRQRPHPALRRRRRSHRQLRRQRDRDRQAHQARAGQRRSGAVLVGDPFNNRIQRYTLSTCALSAPPASLRSRAAAAGTRHAADQPDRRLRAPGLADLSGCPSGCELHATPRRH